MRRATLLLHNAFLLTMDGDNCSLNGYDVLVQDGAIVKIGKKIQPNQKLIVRQIDCTGKVVIPGLINTHSHLTEILQRSFRDNVRMEAWREYRSRTEEHARLTPKQIQLAATLACCEMIKNGVTAVVDHFSTSPKLTIQRMKAIISAFRQTGIRGVLAPSLRDTNFIHVLTSHNRSRKNLVLSRVQKNPSWQNDILSILEYIKQDRGRIGLVLGPTSPLNCTDTLLREVVSLAEAHDLGIHMHYLETKLQQWASKRLYRNGLGERMWHLNVFSPRLSAAHCIWLGDRDIELMAKSGSSAVHNPASNLKLGSGMAPINRLLKAGVNVALGTDGGDTSDSYSIFNQMRLAAYLSRVMIRDSDLWITAPEALKMGTVNGSQAIPTWRGKIGKIKQGYRADLVILTPRLGLRPLTDVVNQIVFGDAGHSVDTVMIDGEIVLMNGRLTRVNEKVLIDEVETISKKMAKIYVSLRAKKSIKTAVRRINDLYTKIDRTDKKTSLPVATFH